MPNMGLNPRTLHCLIASVVHTVPSTLKKRPFRFWKPEESISWVGNEGLTLPLLVCYVDGVASAQSDDRL